MIQELARVPYLGVICSHCNERIPVPMRGASLYEELQHGEVSDGQDTKSRAFALRCKACDGESVYGIKEFQEFEGPPRTRSAKHKAAQA